ncbi:S10 family peptidase [Caulobacter sp. S45]|uniref:S10 family peptidase n=1 Tax=Caulobacter sp. S45 TaxID=1641861 RepID=UPI0020C67639|nr:peptidase S10 [Caulobacter sp. S45]
MNARRFSPIGFIRIRMWSWAFAVLATAGIARAQDRAASPPSVVVEGAKSAGARASEAQRGVGQGWAQASAEERRVVTSHTVTAQGRSLAYKAEAGTLTTRDPSGKPVESLFYVAYTLNSPGSTSRRPVTFLYNGGPGSSNLWLHMGSFAPVRVRTKEPEAVRPAPFDFGPNPETLLDKTDLVFIDAPGTGYSRALGDTEEKAFWGVDQDADVFARGILRYVTTAGRWNSPKYLLGESYGTTRAGAVAYQLQDRGMALNGVILMSTILNYGIMQPGYDHVYISYLPSFAVTAWYHHRLADPPADVATVAAQARAWALGPYAAALAKGQTITPQELDSVARQMSALTGLSIDFIKRANLRVDLDRFQKELLRDQRMTTGRMDARYKGVDSDAAGATAEYDPMLTSIYSLFFSCFSDYVRKDLGFVTDLDYRSGIYDFKGFDWDWRHKAPGGSDVQKAPDTAIDLSAAMRFNPHLRVISLNGYYDMATPFFATEYDIAHMMLEPALQKNLQFHYYEAGHMIFLNPQALHQLHTDLAAFYDDAETP